ncbi:MAG: biotin/lipoyl-binding protein, partial [Lentisphaeria bacterium]|nr:biotin/lipoyl-binding protein [Lentisphaeria bacterium]
MSQHMTTPQPAVFQSSLRGKVRLFAWLIIGALLMLPTAILLMFLIDVDDTIICEGTVIPKDTYELVAPIEGAVKEVCCRTGDQVRKGDLLVQLDDTEFQNEKKRIEAAIQILNSELQVKEHDLKLQLDATEYILNASKVEAAIKSLEKA